MTFKILKNDLNTIAAKILQFSYIKSEENVSDILTKPLANQAFHYLAKKLLFRVPEIDKEYGLKKLLRKFRIYMLYD